MIHINKKKRKKITHLYSTSSSNGRLKNSFCAIFKHRRIKVEDPEAARATLAILILVLAWLQITYIKMICSCVRLVPVEKNIIFWQPLVRDISTKNYWARRRLRVTIVSKMKLILFTNYGMHFSVSWNKSKEYNA